MPSPPASSPAPPSTAGAAAAAGVARSPEAEAAPPPASTWQPLWALRHASRVFWICNLVNMVDGAAYFGLLNVLSLYLGGTLHFPDAIKHPAVSFLTATVTLSGALLGGLADRLGVRRTITWTIVLALLGRSLLGAAPFTDHGQLVAWLSLVLIGISGGVIQPALYTGVKQSVGPGEATMAFSLLYALMNAGSLAENYLSPLVRDRFLPLRLPGGESLEYAGVVWWCAAITVVYLAVHLLGFPRGQGGPAPRPALAAGARPSWRDHALLNPRFQFFIFILLGVRTLFAHQFLTVPDYISRAFDRSVADRFEWVLSINPLVILVGTPLLAALTRRVHVVDMMVVGTLVSAAATFVLVPGPTVTALIAYEILFSLGEALWSSRFLEYVADVAPPAHVGLYMGVAQIPWFLAKTTTGLYSGVLLARFCPEQGPQATGTLWLIYGLIGMVSPLGLFVARRWLKAGGLGRR